jgi:phytol kinase
MGSAAAGMKSVVMNGAGLLASYLFVFGLIGAVTVLLHKGLFSPFTARKVVHIGVSHWWLLAMAMFDDPWVASIGPASFIVINALALRFHLLSAMEAGPGGRNLGTVYFPISLLILVNLCWRGLMPAWVGALAVLILGWGDGLAALMGIKAAGPVVRIWGKRKTVAGSAAMFGVAFLLTLAFSLLFSRKSGFAAALPVSLAIAAAAALVELLTPLGIDNLTVPLASAFLSAGLLL